MSIKAIPGFKYHSPLNVEEVLELLAQYGSSAKIMAGGTDLIPKMKGGVLKLDHVISLRNVEELKYISYDENKGLSFGACISLREMEKNNIIKEKYPALYEGCHVIASTQIRNAGTVVGNICNAVPSADSAPALLVLDAVLTARKKGGERQIPISEFFTGVCKTVLEPDELITKVTISAKKETQDSIYYGFTLRRALDLAMVGVAANITVQDGVCQNARIALGAAAITPKRARDAEAMLIGKKIDFELADAVGLYASENECSPISDIRATREYRKEIVHVLVRDSILVTSGLKEREMLI